MQTMILEFDDEKALHEAVDHIWNKLGVTGEMNVKPLGGNTWRLEIATEKPLRPNTLENIRARRIE